MSACVQICAIRARRWRIIRIFQGSLVLIFIFLNAWSGYLHYIISNDMSHSHAAKAFVKWNQNVSLNRDSSSEAYSRQNRSDGSFILTSEFFSQADLKKSLNKTISKERLLNETVRTEKSLNKTVRTENSFNKTVRKEFFDLFNMSSRMEPESCDGDFGFQLVHRWKNAARNCCRPTITCHKIKQTKHGGDGDNLCVIENATLDLESTFNDTKRMQDIVTIFRDSKHVDMPYVHFQVPIITTQCKKDDKEWKNNSFPGWNRDWMFKGLNVTSRLECEDHASKPLLVIQRHGFANFYHSSEDFFNAFLALLILRLKPIDVSVLIADLFPWGPYESFWKHLFPEIHTAWELREMGPACFGKIIIGIYGPASPLTVSSRASTCYNSPLVKAYSRWVWSSFDLDYDTARPSDGSVKLLWMSRKSSVKWPEHAYCDDRYFNCTEWQHLGVRPLSRVLKNENEVLSTLRNRTQIEVNAADFNVLPFAEQVQTVFASDVLAGVHGAGLTHLLFLPDDSCVFEVFIDGSESKKHYQNMATWRGIPYGSFTSTNPAKPGKLVSSLWAACVEKFLSRPEHKNKTFS